MSRIFALIPAAGIGSRFGAKTPKQYAQANGQPILFHTMNVLNQSTHIEKLAVILSPEDEFFDQHQWPFFKMVRIRCGGPTRAETVINGIHALLHNKLVNGDDWLLVHDAARCCLSLTLLNHFIEEVQHHAVGGLLALPVADTLKRDNGQREVGQTVGRDHLWQAQTPQMFKVGVLLEALTQADLSQITDEASAIEQMGLSPLLINGAMANFKLTFPEDLTLVEAILDARKKG